MSKNSDLVDRVRTALAAVPEVEEKKMFGSVGFMVRGKLCIGARPEHIMCRIDPALQDVVLEHEGCRNVVMKGRPIKGYVQVDADVLSTKGALQYWIELALNYNGRIVITSEAHRR